MLTDGKYILDENGDPKPEYDLLKWSLWFEENGKKRILKQTKIGDDVFVSTVFLGMDYSFSDEPHDPVLWETMIFVKDKGDNEERYSSKEEALEGHERIVKSYEQRM